MKQLIIFLLLGFGYLAHAQSPKSTPKLSFRSINQIGFLSGQAGTEPLAQTINGVQYKTFSTGIGIGLDYYKERSIPLFLDIRKHVFHKPQTPFVYLDGGYHFPWTHDKAEEWIRTTVKGGLYYDVGIGYRFPTFKTGAIHVSLGYSAKNMSETINHNPWRSSWPLPEDYQQFDYTLRRYSFKMGLTL